MEISYGRFFRKCSIGASPVQTNEYDGLGRRIAKDIPGGTADDRDYYYNEEWQLLEARAGSSSNPVEQFVWHPYYIDALAVRYWDGNSDGDYNDTNEGSHFYCQDANFNVTAVVNSSGTVLERYNYTPYGEVTFLDSSFGIRASSLISNTHLYTGRERDPETGLQLNRHRYYIPPLGRWDSRDPRINSYRFETTLADIPLPVLRRLRHAPAQVRSLFPWINELIRTADVMERRIGSFGRRDAGGDNAMPGYQDGMNLYAAYFAPNNLDPTGETIFCGSVGGFGGIGWGGSASLVYCQDNCPPQPGRPDSIWMICVGAGGAVGGGGGVEGVAGTGCISDGFSCQIHGQGGIGYASGGGTVGTGGVAGEAGVGIGAGGAITLDLKQANVNG